jgi:hypothetical protein
MCFCAVRKKRLVVYTAISNNYDTLQDPEFYSASCDYVCFSDDPHLQSQYWSIRLLDNDMEEPTRRAKQPKILPHLYFPDYEYSVWVDGNLTIVGDVQELVEQYLIDHDLALFKHPDGRDCIYQEVEACIRYRKDSEETIRRQEARYRVLNYPEHNGLPACMVILRRHNRPDLIRVMEDWWDEIVHYSKRDQLSFSFVAWKNSTSYTLIDDNARNNRYFRWRPHASAVKK